MTIPKKERFSLPLSPLPHGEIKRLISVVCCKSVNLIGNLGQIELLVEENTETSSRMSIVTWIR